MIRLAYDCVCDREINDEADTSTIHKAIGTRFELPSCRHPDKLDRVQKHAGMFEKMKLQRLP